MKNTVKKVSIVMGSFWIGLGVLALFAMSRDSSFVGALFLATIFFFIPGGMFLFHEQIEAWPLKKKQREAERRRAIWEQCPELRTQYYTLNCHMETGLPIPNGVNCTLNFDGDSLDIQCVGVNYSFSYSHITGMQVQTRTEIQHFLVSSVGRAVAGGMLFGDIGAAVGGRIQHRTIEDNTYYLLVAYLEDNELKYLLFRLAVPGDYGRVRDIVEEQQGKMSKVTFHIEH